MPDAPLINLNALLLEKDEMNAGVVQQIRTALSEASKQHSTLRAAADALERNLAAGKGDPAKTRLKLGVASFFLGRMERAAELLVESKGALAQFYNGLALIDLGRHDEAQKALDAAAKAGYAASEVQMHKAAAYRGVGDLDAALKTLNGVDNYVRNSAEYLFQHGSILLAQGDAAKAIEQLEKAVDADSRHTGALFQLALHNDRQGNDDDAVDYYERCLRQPPLRVGALVNLGILYEDAERYDRAALCYSQVLTAFPNHARAKLFLRDAEASITQSYEDDSEHGIDRFNAIYETPITDFELSVRARNCLKRMGIKTLGDLCSCTEQQLLNSKNFGETSLLEIKNILVMKGLRLGQLAGQQPKRLHLPYKADELSPQEQALYGKPVAELNLSVRARKCMNRLGIATVGELIGHSGDELLECKNFGVTSLVEVREKLKGLSLKLRGD